MGTSARTERETRIARMDYTSCGWARGHELPFLGTKGRAECAGCPLAQVEIPINTTVAMRRKFID